MCQLNLSTKKVNQFTLDGMSTDEILAICIKRAPSTEEIEAYAKKLGVTVEDALNSIALTLARRYDEGEMKFFECDIAVNSLYSWCLLKRDRVLPEPALSVFVAFDEGEYRHSGDADDVDTEVKYTRPMIKQLLRGTDAV
jgi:hypothetical protein